MQTARTRIYFKNHGLTSGHQPHDGRLSVLIASASSQSVLEVAGKCQGLRNVKERGRGGERSRRLRSIMNISMPVLLVLVGGTYH